ncbi:MAG: hypothetical protein JO222_13005, partial [Frankiales bacterium]|nr:hypothetical protein [Frankiales bacterium]
AANNERYTETKRLIAFGRQWSAHHNHLPVVYAGDFNSHTGGGVTFDGPGVAMRRAHFMNSKAVSPTRKQGKYNSGNLYSRIPPAHKGRNEDYVWAAPGEKVTFWREVLSLSHGRFAGTIPSDHNPVVADLLLPY